MKDLPKRRHVSLRVSEDELMRLERVTVARKAQAVREKARCAKRTHM